MSFHSSGVLPESASQLHTHTHQSGTGRHSHERDGHQKSPRHATGRFSEPRQDTQGRDATQSKGSSKREKMSDECLSNRFTNKSVCTAHGIFVV